MSAQWRFVSHAARWQGLANDLALAVRRLEAMDRNVKMVAINQAIMIRVADDMQSLSLRFCAPNGKELSISDAAILMRFPSLPATTDVKRNDGWPPPNGSIDRAISKLAADMLSWTKNPATFELVEHRAYFLFVHWPGGETSSVDEYAYGLWDE